MSVWMYHKIKIKNQNNELLKNELLTIIGNDVYINYDYLNGRRIPIKRYTYEMLNPIDNFEICDNDFIIHCAGNHLFSIGEEYFEKKFNNNVEIISKSEYDDDDDSTFEKKSRFVKRIKIRNSNKSLNNDKKAILDYLKKYPFYLNKNIKRDLYKDSLFCKELLNINGNYLKYMSDKIKDNKNLVKLALKNGGSILDASKRIQKDRKLIIYSIDSCNRSDLYLLQNLPTSIYNDYDIILNHILSTPDFNDFRYNASCKLETNGVKKLFYEKISDRIKKDRKKTLEIIKKDEYFYYFIDNSLKQDKDFVIELIKTNPNILELVDDSLKDDKEFMLEVVKMNSYALKYASDRLRDDEEVIEAAITEDDCEGLKYVNKRFGYRKSFVMDVVRKSKCALKFVFDGFKDDKDVVLEAIKHDSKNILYLNNLFDDKDFLNSIIEYFEPFIDESGKEIIIDKVLLNNNPYSKKLNDDIKNCLIELPYNKSLTQEEKIKISIIAANRKINTLIDKPKYEEVILDYEDSNEMPFEEDDLPF